MARFNAHPIIIRRALMLGLSALAVECVWRICGLPTAISPAILPIWIVAQTVPPLTAFLSASLAAIPCMVVLGDPTLLRAVVLAPIIALSLKKAPSLPAHLTLALAWLIIGVPAFSMLRDGQSPIAGLPMAAIDIFMGTISSAILLHRGIWAKLTLRPKPLRLDELLITLAPMLSTGAIIAATSASGFEFSGGASQIAAALTILVGVIIPGLFSIRLSRWISSDSQELLRGNSKETPHTFSGLTADYWRRQSPEPILRSKTYAGLTTEIGTPLPTTSPLSRPDQGICALNRNGTITFVNRLFKAYAEIRSNNVIGMRLEQVAMNSTIQHHILQTLESTFTKGASVSELRVNELPNRLRFYEISTSRADSYDQSAVANGPESAIILLKDITERRTVESHLLQAQKTASLGRIVGSLSTSFSNALTRITTEASLALHGDGEHAKRALSAIIETTSQAGSILRKLIDYADGRPGTAAPHDLRALLNEQLPFLKRASGVGSEIKVECCELETPISVEPHLLLQAVINLIQNAQESYGKENGPITVTLDHEVVDASATLFHPGARPGRYARLRVKDQGAGMTSETLARAFDPLFTTKASRGHAGLGLSIVFAVVRAHDGFLTAESQPGRGTSISLYLPLHESESIAPSKATQSETCHPETPLPKGNQERIIVIEDDEDLRKLIVNVLQGLGYRAEASESRGALEKLMNDSFDLAVVDETLPTIDSGSLIKQIRTHAPSIPMVVMRGGDDISSPECSIMKPFGADTLAREVQETLSKVSQ